MVVKKRSSDIVLGVTLHRPCTARHGVVEELVVAELFEGGLLASATPLSVPEHWPLLARQPSARAAAPNLHFNQVGDLLRSIDSKPIGGPELENEVNVATYLKGRCGGG